MKKIMAEFKEFISRGNVVDMAVGIMIGAAFKAIVDSLVNDIISPIIGLIAQDNFTNLKLEFWGISIGYGAFIMQIINFFIVAAALFAIIKLMNVLHSISLKKKDAVEEVPEEPTVKVCPFCKTEIAIDATRCPHCTSMLDN